MDFVASMDSKPYVKLVKGCLYCLHWLQSSTRSVHNSRKNQLYTSDLQTRLCDSAYNSSKNQLYTYLPGLGEQAYCDSYST